VFLRRSHTHDVDPISAYDITSIPNPPPPQFDAQAALKRAQLQLEESNAQCEALAMSKTLLHEQLEAAHEEIDEMTSPRQMGSHNPF
jgi:hypothetical protein